MAKAQYKGVRVEKLKTGQPVIIAEDKSLPICYLYAVVKRGYISDPTLYEGLTGLMGSMLMRGTTHRTREQIQDELDKLGAELDVEVEAESLAIVGQTLQRNLAPFLDIFADVILHPTFPEDELEKEKRESISDLKQMRENDRALVKRFYKRALFQSHPYGIDSDGKEVTIARISRKAVAAHYHKLFVDQNVFFAASGDLDTKLLIGELSQRFSDFPKGEMESFVYPDLPKREKMDVILVDKPARTQTQIMMGHLGIDIHHPDFFPLAVANNAFGGGFTSRLMNEVRVKRGWSYGAYSWYGPKKVAGEFTMWVFPAAKETMETLELMISLYDDYVKNGITREEFDRSKSNLINEFAFKIDTPKKRVEQLVTMALMGLPDDYLDTYQDKLRGVTYEVALSAIRRQADPKNLLIVMVCTANQFQKTIKKLGKNIGISTKPYTAD